MRIKNGQKLYTTGDISKIVGKSTQTINIWYKYSESIRDYKMKGEPVIPKCTKINGIKYWTKDQLKDIRDFSTLMKRGMISSYTRKHCWGSRGKSIQQRYDDKKEKEYEANKRFRELPLHEQNRVRQEERCKIMKKKLKKSSKDNKKSI